MTAPKIIKDEKTGEISARRYIPVDELTYYSHQFANYVSNGVYTFDELSEEFRARLAVDDASRLVYILADDSSLEYFKDDKTFFKAHEPERLKEVLRADTRKQIIL